MSGVGCSATPKIAKDTRNARTPAIARVKCLDGANDFTTPPVLRRFSGQPNGEVEGRPEAPSKRHGRIQSSRARGAYPPTVHGPLQRVLDSTRALCCEA